MMLPFGSAFRANISLPPINNKEKDHGKHYFNASRNDQEKVAESFFKLKIEDQG